MRPVRVLADGSYEAILTPSAGKGKPIRVRVLHYWLTDPVRDPDGKPQRWVTTLLHPVQHPALDLITLYHERWEIELCIDECDTHLRQLPHAWRSRTLPGVVHEAYSLLILYNALRMLMAQAAAAHGDAQALSFTDCLQELLRFLPDLARGSPRQRTQWTGRLLANLGTFCLPERRERRLKCPQSKFPAKRAKHRHPPPLAGPFRECVRLILVQGEAT